MSDYDFPSQTALVTAMQAGQRWKGRRSAPADGHPDLIVEAGLRVETHTRARGDRNAFLVDIGPLVEARSDDYAVVVTDDDPGEDFAAAVHRVVEVAAAQLRTGGPLEAVREATERLAALRRAEQHWQATIRAAVADKERVVDIAEAAGISRERVYQIRDGRR
ncbi:MAG: hypothetical protein JWO67_745 [Streptosporangiaceae bacterium]|nr:hypothetical protein [Streptosporangiaceae bacterium]